MSPSLRPCRSSGNHYRKIFQNLNTFKGFDCKVNGKALGSDREQKLVNNPWPFSESITTKVAATPVTNKLGKAMFESHIETCIDWASFDFLYL